MTTPLRVQLHQFAQVADAAWVADASDLGLRAGQPLPRSIQALDGHRMLVFHFYQTLPAPEREVAGWEYRSGAFTTLTLYND
jgi:hypothetical protein